MRHSEGGTTSPRHTPLTAWSGRLYDRQASNHVAVHHDAAASARRYNKRLLSKAAFAALTATVTACRTAHYEQTLPWDDQGSRLLTVANYEQWDRPADECGRCAQPADLLPLGGRSLSSPISAPTA